MKKLFLFVSCALIGAVSAVAEDGNLVSTSRVTFASAPVGAVNYKALFSVKDLGNGDSLRVYFSQGNLRYDMATREWSFWDKQYQFTGNKTPNNNLPSDTSSATSMTGYLDMFTFGNTGCKFNGTIYSPRKYTASLTYSTLSQKNYCVAGTNFDFGVYNAITNGGNVRGQWRMLDNTEWTFLLNNRTDKSGNILRTMGCITDAPDGTGGTQYVYGLFLFPDAWENPNPTEITISYGQTNASSYNQFTLDQFAELEAAGAVFMPVVGYRNNGSWGNSTNVYYWTAKLTSTSYSRAYGVYFTTSSYSGVASQSNYYNFYCQNPVRLVQNAPVK